MKGSKIPPKDVVLKIVEDSVRARIRIDSQDELSRIVMKKLKSLDKDYIISPIRVKRVALEIPGIEVKAKTRKSMRMPKIEACPICGAEIKPLKVRNLLGQEMTIGYSCTKCGYQSDLEAFMPMKYKFIWKVSKD